MPISASDVIPLCEARADRAELAKQVKLIEDASNGLADVLAGKVKDARSTLSALQRRRAQAAG